MSWKNRLSQLQERDILLTDNTTGNVSISKHGLVPKPPNDSTKFLDGTGVFSTPASTIVFARTDKRRAAALVACGNNLTGGTHDWGIQGFAPGGSGVNNVAADATSWWAEFRTTAVTGNTASLTWNPWAWVNHLPHYRVFVKTGSSISVMRLWFGWANALPGNTDDLGAAATKAVIFRYSTVATDPGWVGLCSDGAAQTVSGNVANIAVSTTYVLEIVVNSTTSIDFSVNGGTAVNMTANIPTSADLEPVLKVETREAVIKSFFVSRCYFEAA